MYLLLLCRILILSEWAFSICLFLPWAVKQITEDGLKPFFLHLVSPQVFRTDLITAMKIPDSYQLSPDDYYVLADPWRQEWEKGVQVPAGAEAIPEPVVR